VHLLTKFKFFLAKIIILIINIFLKIDINKYSIFQRKEFLWNCKINDAVGLSLFLFGTFEYSFVKRMIAKMHPTKKNTLIEIGSNIGAFSIVLAKRFSGSIKIYSYEACKKNYEIFKKNIELNFLQDKIYSYNKIICDIRPEISSQYPVFIYKKNCKKINNSLYNGVEGDVHSVPIEELQLDEKFDPNTNYLLKIDTDGSELNVLRSCESFIKKYKPILGIEINKIKYSSKELKSIINFLNRHDYRVEFLNMQLSLNFLYLDPRNIGINYIFTIEN
jgi:FkbM family methyltransferase